MSDLRTKKGCLGEETKKRSPCYDGDIDVEEYDNITCDRAIISYLGFEIACASIGRTPIEEMAHAGGDKSTLDMWRSGTMPDYSVVKNLSDVFGGVTPENFVFGDFWKEALDKLKERDIYGKDISCKNKELSATQKQKIAAQEDVIDSLNAKNGALKKKLRRDQKQ